MAHRLRILLAAPIAAASLLLASCGSDDSSDAKSSDTTATSSSAVATSSEDSDGGMEGAENRTGAAPTTHVSPLPPTPTVEELNERLAQAFDPDVPSQEKISWLQTAGQDPYLVDKLVEAAQARQVTITIVQVAPPQDGVLIAQADVSIAGTPRPTPVSFVSEDGQWKVSREFTCTVVAAAQLQSAACEE